MVFDKVISKILDNDKNQFTKVIIDESVIDSIVFYSKKSYPNEFLAMFDGFIKDSTLFIDSLIFLPGERSHTGASFNDWLLPPDQKKLGTVHSHPGYNSAYPSVADLTTFSKYGQFHIILCEPYSLETMEAYDINGDSTTFEVARFKEEKEDLMMEDLAEIKKEIENDESSLSEDIFTKINKAFADDDDDFYDNFDDELEKVNKYSEKSENSIELKNPQNIKIQIILNKKE
ncbi:MAG: Mov34/MPN/PAD-1 family protein [archaeon]|nr:Mov34/MPN/PAD-1 family protein [archaeon]